MLKALDFSLNVTFDQFKKFLYDNSFVLPEGYTLSGFIFDVEQYCKVVYG